MIKKILIVGVLLSASVAYAATFTTINVEDIAISGDVTQAERLDPKSYFDSTATDFWVGSWDTTVDRFEIRTNATAGNNGVWSVDSAGLMSTTSGTFTGVLKGKVGFNTYSAAQTLTAATHNSTVVQMTVAGEITMWECTAADVGDNVALWARDAEKIEVVPATGDHFVLFDGTALTVNYELDMDATAGAKMSLLCTADTEWSVFNETGTSTDGGVAD